MTKEQKIKACYGYVDSKSIARLSGCSLMYVYQILAKFDLKPLKTATPRSKPKKNESI